jgi:REP element-mobilizing transposase RayT
MNRGVNHGRIFFGDADRVEFGWRLADIHQRFEVETLAYCLMTNHFHLVVRTPTDALSDAMHHLGSVFTRHTNDRVGRDGPLFRGRFVSLPVTTDAYLQWLVRYVHRNPLDIVGVTNLEQYRWSSLRTYLGYRDPPPFLNLEPVLGWWSDLGAFRRFHHDTPGDTLAVDSLAELDELIAHAIAADDVHAQACDDERLHTTERTVRVLVGDRVPNPRVSTLVARSFPSDGAHRTALSRARARAMREDRVRRIVDDVVNSIAS